MFHYFSTLELDGIGWDSRYYFNETFRCQLFRTGEQKTKNPVTTSHLETSLNRMKKSQTSLYREQELFLHYTYIYIYF